MPIPSGLKIHIMGSIKVRKGIIFLKPQNLSILGGSINPENIELNRLETRLTDLGRVPPKRHTHYEGKLSEIAAKDQPKKKPRKPEVKPTQLSNQSKPVQKSITSFMKTKVEPPKNENKADDDDFSDDEDFSALISSASSNSMNSITHASKPIVPQPTQIFFVDHDKLIPI